MNPRNPHEYVTLTLTHVNHSRKMNSKENLTLISILTPSPTLNRINPRRKERKIQSEKKRGRGRGLLCRCIALPPRQCARRRVEPPLHVERARALAKGAVARPLDGGELTRWGAHAPARGPTTAPSSPRLTRCRRGAERERRRRREWR